MTGFHGFQYGRMECIDKSAGIGRGGGLILLRPLHPEMANLDVVGGFLLGLRVRRRQGFLRPRGAESSPVMEYMWACNGQVSCGPEAL